MENKNARIFVASVAKITKRLKFYGDADISNISLLKLIYKYACYSTTYKQLQRLNQMVSQLQVKDEYICLESQSSGAVAYNSPVGIITIGEENNAPYLPTQQSFLGEEHTVLVFSAEDIYAGYTDDGGGSPSGLVITQSTLVGTLTYDGSPVVLNTILTDPSKLVYTREGSDAGTPYFNFHVYDDNSQVSMRSNGSAVSITVEELLVANVPPTINDASILADNGAVTILTLANFEDNYADVDGDIFGAIKILEVSNSNQGAYYLFGTEVVVGQVITREQIEAGAFDHRAASVTAITTDIINVAVRARTGDQSWIE